MIAALSALNSKYCSKMADEDKCSNENDCNVVDKNDLGDGSDRERRSRSDSRSCSRSLSRDRSWRASKDEISRESRDNDKEVCRNFLNNRCNRGSSCKFEHPKDTKIDHSKRLDARNRSRSPISTPGRAHGIVCRDFMRNMCTRGDNCRFYHPEKDEAKQKSWLTFCLDFQNGRCIRPDCRLVLLLICALLCLI